MNTGITLEDYERLNPHCVIEWQGASIRYATPNRMAKWRVDSLFEKEPVTIAWLARLQSEDVLADVGANVGMYSLLAAGGRGARVYAFEPESQNYALLNRNIVLNGLAARVTAYCVALTDEPGFSALHLSKFEAAGSCHSYGEAVDPDLEPRASAYSQGCVASTLDAMLAAGATRQPSYLKIDVDGFEHKVIAGAARTLADPALRSLLIEVNPKLEQHRALLAQLESLGFRYDPAQVALAERSEGPFKGVAEYVFER